MKHTIVEGVEYIQTSLSSRLSLSLNMANTLRIPPNTRRLFSVVDDTHIETTTAKYYNYVLAKLLLMDIGVHEICRVLKPNLIMLLDGLAAQDNMLMQDIAQQGLLKPKHVEHILVKMYGISIGHKNLISSIKEENGFIVAKTADGYTHILKEKPSEQCLILHKSDINDLTLDI